MVEPSLVKEWIDKAEEDFRFAEANLKEREEFFPQICFHFQQAAEKYLKAFIVAFELEFKKIHDLAELLEICEVKESSFKDIADDCEFLNEFYMETRYPVHWPIHYTLEEGKEAYSAAARIRNFLKRLLIDFLK